MPLVLEDGTGVAAADTYALVATADAYWADRPKDPLAAIWAAAAAVSDKQDGSLREGTAYLDATWGRLYRGVRKTETQGRLWPRLDRTALALTDRITTLAELEAAQAETDKPLLGADGLPLAGVPVEIITAALELAARACSARLAPDKDETGWLKRRKVGLIEREWGAAGIPGGSYGFVDTLLTPVLIGQRNAQWNWA